MARIRSIKPEFWTDSKTGTLSEFAKCLLLGLLGQSDDYGVIEWRPMEWRAKIFPYHSDTTTGAVEKALTEELLPAGLIIMFSRKDDEGVLKQYAFIKNFSKHQVINKPSKPLLDGWKKNDNPKTYAARMGDTFNELHAPGDGAPTDTPTPLPEHYFPERKGKERKGNTEPNGSGAGAPAEVVPMARDARKQLFDEALPLLAKYTGRPINSLRSLAGKWLRDSGDDAGKVCRLVAEAVRDQRADPAAWIEKCLKPSDPDEEIYRGVDYAPPSPEEAAEWRRMGLS